MGRAVTRRSRSRAGTTRRSMPCAFSGQRTRPRTTPSMSCGASPASRSTVPQVPAPLRTRARSGIAGVPQPDREDGGEHDLLGSRVRGAQQRELLRRDAEAAHEHVVDRERGERGVGRGRREGAVERGAEVLRAREDRAPGRPSPPSRRGARRPASPSARPPSARSTGRRAPCRPSPPGRGSPSPARAPPTGASCASSRGRTGPPRPGLAGSKLRSLKQWQVAVGRARPAAGTAAAARKASEERAHVGGSSGGAERTSAARHGQLHPGAPRRGRRGPPVR